MRGHGMHMWLCGAMIVAAVVTALATGTAAFLLPALGCVLMMGAMMWMMAGMGGHRRSKSD